MFQKTIPYEFYKKASKLLRFFSILKPVVHNFIWFGGRAIYYFWFNLTSHGTNNLPKSESYLIVANHVSHLDGSAIIAAQGIHSKDVYSLAAKDYFFNQPIKGWFCINFLNMIPIERNGNSLDYLHKCKEILLQGKYILMFPEGTRSINGELQSLKLGLGFLALKLNVSIVPVYVHGTYTALPKGQHLPKKHPIHVRFGEPLKISLYKEKQKTMSNRELYQEIVNDVKSAIEQLRKETVNLNF
ncbi:lysophospholipid acyltransferase family protein [Nostoc sp. NMS4]|uniref:lysophospholipid acyltransferase family protein n=1 Tax=Nostoc sp. NMS4 TaxID=2815390 RepID=UPI0025E2D3A7|nr:lysophospholipid acyltransferase family protein [Nostoc sp. NMS4]MBN3927455.1 1-acyl-sn-glycerol-3-phosphate acyltransferase [Nostoc sp. NMS4]